MDARHIGLKNMNEADKKYKISVACDLIEKVLNDTDEKLWAYYWLKDALYDLDKWLEESEDGEN